MEMFNRFVYLFYWQDKKYLKDFVQRLQPADRDKLKSTLQEMEKAL